ncbi:MAG: hypothetical protein JSV80_07380 [Acidobacteriota bacterium]|nr:MAG: hypothetical protein JSV80_07380 [Acidobacteriota bacterium]
MKQLSLILTLVVAALTLLTGVASAAPAASPDTTLSDDQRAGIVKAVSDVVNESYIFADVAAEMGRLIEKNLKAKKYDDLETLGEMARQLTEDLRSVSHDLHLRVDPLHEMAEDDPEEEAAIRARRLERMRRQNYGFRKVQLRGDNIGYLELVGFDDAGVAGNTAVAAMNYLANCDALIIDLRANGGGDPSMIQLISSYFFEEPQHLNSFYIRKQDETQQFWTQANVQGPKLIDTPIYVLTSRNTFSAAEEFTYNLKNMKRATIVGETTGGGAHPVEFEHRPEAMVTIKVPYGRAINPITKTNWEGTGVEPDIAVPAEDALLSAEIEATKALMAKASSDEDKARHQWALEAFEAYRSPAALEPARLAGYVGQYGPRRVTLEEGTLCYEREGSTRFELVPMGDDVFAFRRGDEYIGVRVQFERDDAGQVTHFFLMSVDQPRFKSDPRAELSAAERE